MDIKNSINNYFPAFIRNGEYLMDIIESIILTSKDDSLFDTRLIIKGAPGIAKRDGVKTSLEKLVKLYELNVFDYDKDTFYKNDSAFENSLFYLVGYRRIYYYFYLLRALFTKSKVQKLRILSEETLMINDKQIICYLIEMRKFYKLRYIGLNIYIRAGLVLDWDTESKQIIFLQDKLFFYNFGLPFFSYFRIVKRINTWLLIMFIAFLSIFY